MTFAAAFQTRLRHLRRFRTVSRREVGDLLHAQAALVAAWWAVRWRPRGTLLTAVPDAGNAARRALDEARLERILTAVDRASRLGLFTPACLVRAIALESLIRRHAIGAAVVKVGVLRNLHELLAHAWVELDGRVIGDDPSYVKRFVPLHDFSVLTR